MKQKTIELLAPAKNLAQEKLAISCGADAVYIGPKNLGPAPVSAIPLMI